VRISPNDIHLSDPENYDKIYFVGTKFWKSPNFYSHLGVKTAAVTTLRNELHRVRRAAINPLFSRKVVLDLEEVVQSKVQRLCQLLSDKLKAGEPMDLHYGFRAVSVDVITDYAFDNCFDLLETPTLGTEYFDLLRGLVPSFWIFQQFPFVQKLSTMLPPWLLIRLSPEMSRLIQLQIVSEKWTSTGCALGGPLLS
jgi:cytochrome P450